MISAEDLKKKAKYILQSYKSAQGRLSDALGRVSKFRKSGEQEHLKRLIFDLEDVASELLDLKSLLQI